MYLVILVLVIRLNILNQVVWFLLLDNDIELDFNFENFDVLIWSFDIYVVIFLIFEICIMNMDDDLYFWCDDVGCFG